MCQLLAWKQIVWHSSQLVDSKLSLMHVTAERKKKKSWLFTECCEHHINRKLSGRRIKCWSKRCTSNRKNHCFEITGKQSPFKNLEEIQKEWTEAARDTKYRLTLDMGTNVTVHVFYFCWGEKKLTVAQWSQGIFSAESKCWTSFGTPDPIVWKTAKVSNFDSVTLMSLCLNNQETQLIWTYRNQWAVVRPWTQLSKKPGLPLHLHSRSQLWPTSSRRWRPRQVLSAKTWA